jgi:hypothetical protein
MAKILLSKQEAEYLLTAEQLNNIPGGHKWGALCEVDVHKLILQGQPAKPDHIHIVGDINAIF